MSLLKKIFNPHQHSEKERVLEATAKAGQELPQWVLDVLNTPTRKLNQGDDGTYGSYKTGPHILYHEDGTIRSILTHSDQHYGRAVGSYIHFHTNGTIMRVANFDTHSETGWYQQFEADGFLSEEGGCHTHHALHGPYKKYHSNRMIAETGTRSYGERNGLLTQYHEDSHIKAIQPFQDGKRLETYRERHENGTIAEEYSNPRNSSNSSYKKYDKDSNLIEEHAYDPHGESTYTKYHSNGQLREETVYENDKLKGTPIRHHFDGQPLYFTSRDDAFPSRIEHADDNDHVYYYDENNQILAEGEMRDGVAHGLWHFVQHEGSEHQFAWFDQGVKINNAGSIEELMSHKDVLKAFITKVDPAVLHTIMAQTGQQLAMPEPA
jgi:YD repeat-containing protein